MSAILRCPKCSYSRHWRLRREKRKCKRCRSEFSPKHVQQRRVGIPSRREITSFIEKKTVRDMADALACSLGKAQHIAHQCRTIISTKEVPPFFHGPVEVDETYIGAQRKNKRLHIRRREPTKVGMGTTKLPIFGFYDRNTGYVYVDTLPYNMNINAVIARLLELVPLDTTIYTDGCVHYRTQLTKVGYDHHFIEHTKGEYVRGNVHTNSLEGFWGIMKRTMGCIGGMKRERLHLFAKEIAWRHNYRHYSLQEQVALLSTLFLL